MSCKNKNQNEMSNHNLDQLVSEYIKAWSTTNSDDRKNLVESVYSDTAKFFANEPGDEAVNYQGWKKIHGNITQVNNRLTVENGLITELIGFTENHGTLRVTWQMKTANGEIALKGMNFLKLTKERKIKEDYIFIN
jgi:hypothetical protein